MSPAPPGFSAIRRIVTRNDEQGRAVVWLDGEATNHRPGYEGRRSTLIWATGALPANFRTEEDAGQWQLGTPPPPGGSRFAVIETLPGETYPALHRTDTIDYVICLAGEITMDLDDSTVTMGPGDVLVQLGTNHGWRNAGGETAVVAFVLLDAEPKGSPDLPAAVSSVR